MSIIVDDVSKRFGDFQALRSVSLETEPGEFLALLGPSGSGKTTLLRIIAGLDFADQGRIEFDGDDMTDLPAAKRGIGFVFQNYALFRHMTVADNIAFGLTVRKRRDRPAKAEVDRRVSDLLELMQLPGLGVRYPAQLSGGQRQRVALARALAVEPRLLLLDEPFGALDAQVRRDLRSWLRDIHERMGLTSIFVTHDQEEALELADRVVVMRDGAIEQVGSPSDIYERPATAFVSEFVGDTNRLNVVVRDGRVVLDDQPTTLDPGEANGAAELHFRPHSVALAEAEGGIAMKVFHSSRRGGNWRVDGSTPGAGQHFGIELPATMEGPAAGSILHLSLTDYRLFPAK